MQAVHHVCRRARREDIRRSMPLWVQDRALYDWDVWESLPALLEDLLQRDLVSFAVIESLPSHTPRLFGGISFIRAEYMNHIRVKPSTLPNSAMRAVLENRRPFLSPREIAEENACGELQLLNFFGNVDVLDLSNPELADLHRVSNEGHRFFHFGYSFRAMWADVCSAHHVEELQKQGMQIERQLRLANGTTATLMRLTRDDALANPYARFSGYFFPPRPCFAFSLGEQRLLEYALLEASDEKAAKELLVSDEAIKKRWRSIYSKVEAVDPDLLSDHNSGAGRRRAVLHYLRQHLEELRPYREASRAMTNAR